MMVGSVMTGTAQRNQVHGINIGLVIVDVMNSKSLRNLPAESAGVTVSLANHSLQRVIESSRVDSRPLRGLSILCDTTDRARPGTRGRTIEDRPLCQVRRPNSELLMAVNTGTSGPSAGRLARLRAKTTGPRRNAIERIRAVLTNTIRSYGFAESEASFGAIQTTCVRWIYRELNPASMTRHDPFRALHPLRLACHSTRQRTEQAKVIRLGGFILSPVERFPAFLTRLVRQDQDLSRIRAGKRTKTTGRVSPWFLESLAAVFANTIIHNANYNTDLVS